MNTSPRSSIRQKIRLLRNNLNLTEQSQAESELFSKLITCPKIISAQHIAVYLANDSEIKTSKFIEWCWQNNKQVYLPVIHPFTKGQLLFLEYTSFTKMAKNSYGISEPKLDVRLIKLVEEIDILITPLVAFDKQGNRLGMGGGFYDRTLQNWFLKYQRSKITSCNKSSIIHDPYTESNDYLREQTASINNLKPIPIGIAHNCQYVDELPSESWDIPLPTIITPSKIYHFELTKE